VPSALDIHLLLCRLNIGRVMNFSYIKIFDYAIALISGHKSVSLKLKTFHLPPKKKMKNSKSEGHDNSRGKNTA
jgi:hypothetical protein